MISRVEMRGALPHKMAALVMVGALALAGCGAGGDDATEDEATKFTMEVYGPEPIMLGKSAALWKSEVEKSAGGQLELEAHYGGSLVGITEIVDAVSSGLSDVALIPVANFEERFPLTAVGHLLYQTDSPWVMAKSMNDLHSENQTLQAEFESANVVFQTAVPIQPALIASREQIVDSQDDLQGQRIRSFGYLSNAFEKLGATPVDIPGPELYQALESGVVDMATGIPFDVVEAQNLQEVTPYLTQTSMGVYSTVVIVINRDSWDKLSQDVKDAIQGVNADYPDMVTELIHQFNEESYGRLVEAGIEYHELPDDEAQKWRAVVEPEESWRDWVQTREDDGLPAQEVLDRYQDLVAEYEENDIWAPIEP